MNDAHLHLVLNHFPIIGPILGLGILLTGMILKNDSVKNTAYVLFIVSAIFAAFSMGTGDGAEEVAEKLPGVTKQIIHEHEELAEKLTIVLYLLALISIGGLFLSYKKHAKAKLVSYVALVVAVVGVFLAKEVGTSGGEVRHTEIRNDANPTATAVKQGEEKDKD